VNLEIIGAGLWFDRVLYRGRKGSGELVDVSTPNTWIALFRGINVGGNNPLPMKTLPALLEKCGCTDAKTYIQSGNVVFRSTEGSAPKLAARIGKAVLAAHKFEPRVLVLSDKELKRAAAANPYAKQAAANPAFVHLFFLAEAAEKAGLQKLAEIQANGEEFELKGKVFYLHTPAGFGISKLAARAERALGVDATARNWRTCLTLIELAAGLGK
jgi:uncharacterized protein (DUF1697 family)